VDQYNWHPGQNIIYPGPLLGAKVPDDWAYLLAHNNSGRVFGNSFSIRGEVEIIYKRDLWFAAPGDLSEPPYGWWKF
jgi:hypothetical protein